MTSPFGKPGPGFSATLNLVVDVSVLLAAGVLSTIFSHKSVSWTTAELGGFLVLASLAWVLTSTALRHYDPYADRDALDDAALVTVLVMAVTTVLAVFSVFTSDNARLPKVGYFLMVFWPVVFFLRLYLFRPLAANEGPLDEILIVGTGPLGRATGEEMRRRGSRRHVMGYLRFPDEPSPEAFTEGPLLGTSDELEDTLKKRPVNEVYIAGNLMRQGEPMQRAVKACERFGVPFALPAYSFRLDRARPIATQAMVDGFLHYLSVDSKPHQRAFKRLFDIVSSAVAVWMLLPLFSAVALIIKITSKGPVFFKQTRVGVHGKPFHMLKFRSMVVDAEALKARLAKQNEQTGPVFKMKNDPRITSIGRFIRKFSIDELPQLINVLRGDMSIVGPRPPVPNEVELYEPWQRRRLSVRPGLTCIWQVSGRNQISFQEWMYLDMQYIDHWSLRQDFNLIMKTFPVVLTGRGAS